MCELVSVCGCVLYTLLIVKCQMLDSRVSVQE